MKQVVFIGGTKDGCLVKIATDRPYIVVESLEPFVCNPFAITPPVLTAKQEVYRPTRWRGLKRDFEIWALEGLTADDVMERLLFKATIANPACPKCNLAMVEAGSRRWRCTKCGATRDV